MPNETEDQASICPSAEKAALRGLDFFVRHQVRDCNSADHGRFTTMYDCDTNQSIKLTINWTTGVTISALLSGYTRTGNATYLESAGAACSYIKSLQDFNPATPKLNGVFHEDTPQTPMAHPRDALTAAWGLLDYATLAKDEEYRERAIRYGNWFVETGLEKGYPYWTVRFDHQAWEPYWCGSFHSGSAFFMHRLYEETGEEKFLLAMRKILDFYNQNHLDRAGNITVIIDRETLKGLDGQADSKFTIPDWEIMHRYNDDFGALANLAAWKVTGETVYRDSATCFLDLMCMSQREDGGFGPKEWCVPSASGAIIIEMMAAKKLGLCRPEYDVAIAKAKDHLLTLQKVSPGQPVDGGFLGVNKAYSFDKKIANIRTSSYAALALLKIAGEESGIYGVITNNKQG